MIKEEKLQLVQRKIAELLGWTQVQEPHFEISDSGDVRLIGYPAGHSPSDDKFAEWQIVPDWLTNRNASWDLIKDFTKLQDGQYLAGPSSAYDESLAYLESEGWCWVECYSCLGTKECQGGDGCHGNNIESCPVCSDGGEWVKVQ